MGTTSFFLGVNDKENENHWVWDSDNSTVNLDIWDSGEPDGGTNENCAYMNRTATNKLRRSRWLSVQCSGNQVARATVVCEKIGK